MSVHISSRAWLVEGLSFAEKLVLLKLADMASDEGVCWPSNATIGAQCGLDLRSVRRIVARLEVRGLVTRQARFKAGGLQSSNWLVVMPPADRRADTGGGDSAVLPVKEDSPVLPARTPRSSLGGTARSSKSSIEPSKNLARSESARAAGRSASSRFETARPASSVATVAVDRGGVAAPVAAPALSSDEKARRAAFVAGLGLPVRDPSSGVWQAAASVLAESGGGL